MAAVRARRGPVDIGLLTGDRRVAAELAAAVAAHTGGLVLTVAWLLTLAAVIDGAFLDGRDLGSSAPLLAVMVGLVLARSAVVWVGDVVAARASGRLRARIRSRLVEHVVAVGPAGLAHERVGEVSSTIGTGVDELDGYVTRFVPAAALATIGPLVVFATIAWLDPWTTVILLFAGPMLVLLLAVIGSRTRTLTERRFEQLGWLSAFYLDMIRGLATLKAFRRSEEGADTIEDVSRRFGDTTMEVLRTAFQTSLVMEWAATAATALVAVQVSFRMIHDDLPFGTGLAILVLTPEFFVPLRRLALEYHAGQSGDAALARIAEIEALPVSAPVTPVTPAATMAVTASVATDEGREGGARRPGAAGPTSSPSIVFERVSHRYPGADRDALHELDLRIEAGETLALVGPSGAGKTTVSRLLLRFADPTAGRILIDGRPLDRLDLAGWRRAVAWVPQDPTILAGTVADNIRLGDPDASADRVRRAAGAARATEFVEALPLGFDTVLGEEGLQLSGGQRQRLAIARAALRDAPVVVLDEFTAHLDDAVEIEVRAAIGDLLRGRTALVIAHRSATAAMADRTVRLDQGRVAPGSVGGTRRPPGDPEVLR